MRQAERFPRGAEFDNGNISQKHHNKGCCSCRVHTSNFSPGLEGCVGQIDDLFNKHNGEV